MNSNENTPQEIIQKLNDYLEGAEEERWLADVFCIWDQEEHTWLAGTPVLIRTEMHDVLLSWPDGLHLEVGTESIDTYDIIEEGTGLCWRRRPCMSHFIGSAINRFVFVPSPAGDELFIYFVGGESMRLAATRIVSHILLSAA